MMRWLPLAIALVACSTDTFVGGDASSEGGACTKAAPSGTGCANGECYCADQKTCYAATEAPTCCSGAIICSADGGGSPDAAGCAFKHPLLDGGARFCAAGECYCAWSNGESCYAAPIAAECCPSVSFICY